MDWQADWDYSDGQSWIAGFYAEVTLHVRHFRCDVCGLELKGDDEVEAAGIGLQHEITDFDPSDFMEEEPYEPDRLDEW